ncbi:hypothetical protein K502DRAFT_327600 [Neoconidiobolus thromboides FSU 785]|nr:hypothetical protein K502DRAFT_327600 [Neoconidiobolus thromboides FSU 785]
MIAPLFFTYFITLTLAAPNSYNGYNPYTSLNGNVDSNVAANVGKTVYIDVNTALGLGLISNSYPRVYRRDYTTTNNNLDLNASANVKLGHLVNINGHLALALDTNANQGYSRSLAIGANVKGDAQVGQSGSHYYRRNYDYGNNGVDVNADAAAKVQVGKLVDVNANAKLGLLLEAPQYGYGYGYGNGLSLNTNALLDTRLGHVGGSYY